MVSSRRSRSSGSPLRGLPLLGSWLRRIGWLGFALAVGAFVYGAIGGFTPASATVVVIGLAGGSAALLPGIIIGFGAGAAEREERQATDL